MTKRIAVLCLACVAAAGIAQKPARSVQQEFEAAAALDAESDKAAALAAWDALDRRTLANPRSHAIVLVRKSAALLAVGRSDDAVAAARAGLAALPTTDPTLVDDRLQAWFTIGRVAARALDYASAGGAFAEAETVAVEPVQKLRALLAIIEIKTFTDPDAALAASMRADAIMAENKVGPQTVARFAEAKGTLLLNRGDLNGGRKWSIEAVKLLGGLTEKTDIADVSARSTAAIALLLGGDASEARRYMAMTGAGRIAKGSFDPAAQMTPPDCGGEAGLKPSDMAVVEFSIAADGTVSSAVPIYAAGGGAVALEFARAARDWWWTPEQVKALPAFFRYNARVEMRCNMAFGRPSVGSTLGGDLGAWLAAKGYPVPERRGSDVVALAGQRAALAAAETKEGPAALATMVPLVQLIENAILPREERNVLARRALGIAVANGAPPTARLALDLSVRSSDSAEYGKSWTSRLTALLAEQPYAGDPAARNALRLFIADNERGRSRDRSRAALRQIVDDSAIAANDPLRVGALIRIASLEQEAGDTEAARAAFEKSGLAANQCAIIDDRPRQLKVGGTFPYEAQIWGFEGWSRMQWDIDADGRVKGARAIVSYPPFVFTKAATETIGTAVYAKSYRPDGGLGCGAMTNNVKFIRG